VLTKVEARYGTGVLGLTLVSPTNGYIIEDIKGLGPVDAVLSSSKFGSLDGEQFHSARRTPRNVVFTIKLTDFNDSGKSVRTLRSDLTYYFMPKQEVALRFYMSDGLVVNITGVVENFETDLFVKDPRITISIMCYDPDFVDNVVHTISGNTTSSTDETSINCGGTIGAGMVLTLNVNRTMTNFDIYLRYVSDGTRKTMAVAACSWLAQFLSGDVFTINTTPGQKSAVVVRSDTPNQAVYTINPSSDWPLIRPGLNMLRVYASGAAVPYTVSFANRYGSL
jgi:hypothetical protein